MKIQISFFLASLFLALMPGQADESPFTGLTDWYVDAVNGDDAKGIGSLEKPFKGIRAVLAVNDMFPGFVGAGDTIHLAAGNYDAKPIIIDVPDLKIEGALNDKGMPVSILGDVKVTADGVTLESCLFYDAELTLRGVERCMVKDSLFSGKTKNSLTLMGSSNNSIMGNRFESAKDSCVVILGDSKSKQPSNDNIFQTNYFTHHPEKKTDQIILSNKKGFMGKKRISARNRFLNCVFEEITSGHLKHVVVENSTWRMVEDHGYSLIFEDCYFKRADRRLPFINFVIVKERSGLDWYWDELINDTWVTSNDGHNLTGHKGNRYIPSIQFADGDDDGLILETTYSFKAKHFDGLWPSEQTNRSPVVVNEIADIAVYENAAPDTINLFDVFEDTVTADENFEFTVKCDNTSLVNSQLEDGLLTLQYARDTVGMALVKVTATDDDSVDPKSVEESFHIIVVEDAWIPESNRSDWYVDSMNGDDENGTGSQSNPFKTLEHVLAIYAKQPSPNGAGSTIHLGEGKYGLNVLELNIPGLSIEGTLGEDGRPLTVIEETIIAADDVRLMNCNFNNVGLTLLNVENVLISNNTFTGIIDLSLRLLGASNNMIQHNDFSSAVHDCVHISWDSKSGKPSNDNTFLRNYFTHRSDGTTSRIIRVKWSVGNNKSISARNRFVECAFKETKKERLLRIIDDNFNWWMVAKYKYSVAFEDCYFKRADRANPFSEFVILKGYPDFTWRWDELINDKWVSSNMQLAITGDHNGWKHRPRIQFVDKNENGKALEIVYDAGLSSNGRGIIEEPLNADTTK